MEIHAFVFGAGKSSETSALWVGGFWIKHHFQAGIFCFLVVILCGLSHLLSTLNDHRSVIYYSSAIWFIASPLWSYDCHTCKLLEPGFLFYSCTYVSGLLFFSTLPVLSELLHVMHRNFGFYNVSC